MAGREARRTDRIEARSGPEAAQIIRLSVDDQRRLADSILDPQPPNEALRRAADAHRRLTGEP